MEIVTLTTSPGLLRRGTPQQFWTAAALALLATTDHGAEELYVTARDDEVVLGLAGAPPERARWWADSLAELLSPPTHRPRFVLELEPLALSSGARPGPLHRWWGRLALRRRGEVLVVAVPRGLARARTDIEALVDS